MVCEWLLNTKTTNFTSHNNFSISALNFFFLKKVHYYQHYITQLNYRANRAIFDAPLEDMCLTLLGTSIKNCSIVKPLSNKIKYYIVIQLLDKCLRGNEIAPFGTHALLHLSLVLKGCNFIAPLALIYPAISYGTIFLLLLAHCDFTTYISCCCCNRHCHKMFFN